MSRQFSIVKQSILSVVNDHLIDYPTPSNLSYWWSFGSLAGLCILLQILAMVFYFAWLNENEWLLGFQNAFIPMIRSIFDMSQDMLFFFTIFFFLLISWMFLRLSLLLYARNCPIPERMALDNFTMGTIAHSSFIQQFFRFIQCSLFLAMSWYYTRPGIYRLGLFIIAWLGFCFVFNYAECAPPKSHPHINLQYGDTAPSVSAPPVSGPSVSAPPVAEPSVSAPPVSAPAVPMPEGIPEIVISQDERQRFVKGVAKLIQDPEMAKLSCKEIASLFVDNFSTLESEPTSSIKPFIETLKDPRGKDAFVSRMCAPRPEVPTEPTVTEGGAEPIISTAQQEKRSWNEVTSGRKWNEVTSGRKWNDWLYELRTNFDPKLAQEGCDLFLETFPHLPNSLAIMGAGGVAYRLATALNTLKPSVPPVAKAAFVTGATLATAFGTLAMNQSMLKTKLEHKLEKARIDSAPPEQGVRTRKQRREQEIEDAPPEQGVRTRRQRREQEQADTSAFDQPNDMGSSGEAVIGRQVSLGNPSPSPNNPPTSSGNSLFSTQDWAQDYESWTSWSLSLFDLTGYSLSDFSPIVSSMVFLFFALRSRSLFHFYLKSTFWWSFSPTLGFNDLSLKGWIFGIIKIPYEAFQTLTKPLDDTGDFSRLVLEQIHILIYLGPYCIFIIFMGLFLILVQGNLARFLRYILSKPWIQNSRLRKLIEFYARLRDWMHKYLTAIGYTLILIGCLEGLICFYLLASYLNLLEQ